MIDIVLLGNRRGPLHEGRSPVSFKRGLAQTLDGAEVAAVVEYISRDFWNREAAVGPEEVFARECRYDLPAPFGSARRADQDGGAASGPGGGAEWVV